MSDFILLTGDQAIFIPAFGMATVVVSPGNLKGNGEARLNGQKICIDGDEKDVAVPGCAYTTAVHSIPGTGTLKIDALGGDQKAQKTNCGGKPVLLKGSTFTAKFEVTSPAQKPPNAPGEPPTPDHTPQYSGMGNFMTNNTKWTGS